MRTLKYFLMMVVSVYLCCLGWTIISAEEKGQKEKKLKEAFDQITGLEIVTRKAPDKDKKLIEEVFDLKKPEVTKFLIRQMNIPSHKDESTWVEIPRKAILLFKREERLLWLLENYDEFTDAGRKAMIKCIALYGRYEWSEYFEICFRCLRDKTHVPVPPIFKAYGAYARVCDYAYESLIGNCRQAISDELAKNLRVGRRFHDPIEERDKRINLLISWWESDDSYEFRQSKKSLAEEEGVDLFIVDKIHEQMKALGEIRDTSPIS